jgi:hypothetical protein
MNQNASFDTKLCYNEFFLYENESTLFLLKEKNIHPNFMALNITRN